MGRAPCCDKANVKKGPWSPEEDAKLKSYIEKHGTGGNWIALPQKVGLKRCGKSCRLRWLNYLRPNIKHGGFSEEEDKIILSLYISIGSRWSIIAAQLPGRTDNDIKNYWNTRLKKKLLGKQRKDQQNARKEAIDYKFMQPNPLTSTILNYNQIPYYSQLSLPSATSFPTSSIQGDTLHSLNDNVSLRKLLMKVEGHCDSINDNALFQYYGKSNITQISALHQEVVNNGMIASTSTFEMSNPSQYNLDQGEGVGVELFGGENTSFPPEIEELMSSNPQRVDGLEFLYGDYGGNLVNNDGSTSESSEWNEMNSMASLPNLDSDCSNNVIIQGIDEEHQFQESLKFGMPHL